MNFDRQIAVDLLESNVKAEHIIRHSYAVEAVMRKLAQKFDPDNEDLWAMAGLLHDLDEDLVDWKNFPALHGPKSIEVLKNIGYGNEELYHAILAHNPATKTKINTALDRCIYASDPITGFINAIALVYPSKNIHDVKVKSIVKRMKETRFAAGANREAMRSIEKLMPFAEFAELSLEAMKEISETLGFPKPTE